MGFTVHASPAHPDREVCGGYVSDLLSDVLAHSRPGDLWVTLHAHETAVAIAKVCDLVGILLTGGREPAPESVTCAEREGIAIVSTPLPAFEVVSQLIGAGVPERGRTR
jgi:hypothetical protein